MDNVKFLQVVERALAEVSRKVECKGEEYSRVDRLSNFKRAAAKRETTPEDALMGMNAKHEISLEDMVDDIGRGVFHPYEVWLEKTTDNIVYNLCLLGLTYERLYPEAVEKDLSHIFGKSIGELLEEGKPGVPRKPVKKSRRK